MRSVYEEEKKFLFQKSWYNEIVGVCEKYDIEFDEQKISEMEKPVWKTLVKKKTQEYFIHRVNEEGKERSKEKLFPPVERIRLQRYFRILAPHDARIFFRVRAKMIDLRAVTHYMHKSITCRLCDAEEETIAHVLNCCEYVDRGDRDIESHDIYNGDDETVKDVVRRMKQFLQAVEEKDM